MCIRDSAYSGEEDLFVLAAIYAERIAQNHPFVDGNKRAALLCALAFLAKNGIESVEDRGELEAPMLRLAQSEIGAAEFAEALRRFA